MKILPSSLKLKKCECDPHKVPDGINYSRKPLPVDYEILNSFLKNEINATKMCACPCCDARRHYFRKLQYILQDYYGKRK